MRYEGTQQCDSTKGPAAGRTARMEKLPWWVGFPISIGLGLVGTFAPDFVPEAAKAGLFALGCVCALWGIVAAIRHYRFIWGGRMVTTVLMGFAAFALVTAGLTVAWHVLQASRGEYVTQDIAKPSLPLMVFVSETARIEAKQVTFADKADLDRQFHAAVAALPADGPTLWNGGGPTQINLVLRNISEKEEQFDDTFMVISSNVNITPKTEGLKVFAPNQVTHSGSILPFGKLQKEHYFTLGLTSDMARGPVCFLVTVEKPGYEPFAAIGCTNVKFHGEEQTRPVKVSEVQSDGSRFEFVGRGNSIFSHNAIVGFATSSVTAEDSTFVANNAFVARDPTGSDQSKGEADDA